MGKFKTIPVVALDMKAGSVVYHVSIGSEIESVVVARPYEDFEVSGKVVAISLARRTAGNFGARIYDGISCKDGSMDDTARIHNAAEYFEGDQIAIEDADGKIWVIPCDRIKELNGQFVNPDGSKTVTVDPAANPETVMTAIAEASDGDVIVLAAGEIESESSIVVAASATIAGVNMGVPQNFYQEV